MAEHRGGSGNFAEDREKASEAGRKGVSTAAGTLKMIRSVRPKRVKKADKTATAVAASLIIPDYPFPCTLK